MPCPKCGEKVLLRTAEAKTSNMQYECTRCGHKWIGKNKVILIDKKTKQTSHSNFKLPW